MRSQEPIPSIEGQSRAEASRACRRRVHPPRDGIATHDPRRRGQSKTVSMRAPSRPAVDEGPAALCTTRQAALGAAPRRAWPPSRAP
eukprot:scaffold2250_cov399-Prasinococcus_capsulatus_cf.AAC.6